ncbi:MAG: S8 family serine peptidase, partial [Candidatus Eisenbacteria bacterium]|nr:S8 family serine peptidase [Candidatus Eisenbacteria bacterium]
RLAAAHASQPIPALLILRDQAPIARISTELTARRASRRERHREIVHALREEAALAQPAILERLDALRAEGRVQGYTPYWIANLIVVEGERSAIEELAARDDVAQAEINFRPALVEPVEIPAGVATAARTGIGVTPGLRAIGADRCWYELGVNGTGALLGNLDTGVDGTHPALSGRWRGNHEPWQECWKDVLGTATQFPTDTYGHGTHVMGTETGLGMATGDTIGVAWGAEWIAANAINQAVGGEFDNDVIACFQWFADPDGDPETIDDVADVIQNSWRINEGYGHGYTDCDTRWWIVMDNVEAAGTALVFSAGNEGPGAQTIGSPADRATTPLNAFSVGAVDATHYAFPYPIADFSSRGPSGCTGNPIKPEICAPGVEVYSSIPGGDYQQMNWNGTSMAGPHVAGVVALMRSVDPNLEVDTMKQILLDTARDEGDLGEDNAYGWGVVDAYEAVLTVRAGLSTIGGTITNASDGGVPLPGATIRVLGAERELTSGTDGTYLGFCAPGTYTVEFSHPSCLTDSIPGVVIADSSDVELDFGLTDIVAPVIADVYYPLYQENTTPVRATVDDLSTVARVDLVYRVNGGAWNTIPMSVAVTHLGNYATDIPGQTAGALVEFYVEAEDVAGNVGQEPASAPADLFAFTVAPAYFVDDAENDRGWSLSQPTDTNAGRWVRADPIGTIWLGEQLEPADDHTPDPGTYCFVTGLGTVGGPPQASDVDNGCVTLTSPPIDLSGATAARLSYWRWYGQMSGPGAAFTTSISTNGGATWTWLESISYQQNSWVERQFVLAPYGLSDSTLFRFVACDNGPETLVEAAVDDFVILVDQSDPSAADDDPTALPTQMLPNLPNPFTGATTIRYRLATAAEVRISIFDAGGRRVRRVFEGTATPGAHAIEWTGDDDAGRPAPAGVYLVRFETEDFRADRKIIRTR